MSYSSAMEDLNPIKNLFFFPFLPRIFFLSRGKREKKKQGGKCNLNRSTAEEAEINV